MAQQHAASVLAAALVVGILALSIPAEVQSIGVCYGIHGDVLPSASDVVKLYVSSGITGMRIYDPNADTLAALDGTGIGLIMDVRNDQLAIMASSPDAASQWVQDNVVAYPGVSIRYIAVGNEVNGSDPLLAPNILPAMQNINAALSLAGFGSIKVSTAVQSGVTTGYPPSHGTFSASGAHMPPIAQYLANTGAPLLANVYPYFAFTGTPGIDINYALFTSPSSVVPDDNGLAYHNLFDALVDTFYAALESAGAGSVGIVVSESGWPSAGATYATVANAQMYNQKLINHVGNGTPRVPQPLETYIFAMFNENQKPGLETEKHFGLFNPDMKPAYIINF